MKSRDDSKQFAKERLSSIHRMARDAKLKQLTTQWLKRSFQHKYSYHFDWMGRPIIQYPQDMIAMQELIWRLKPDLIVETGIARGGSLIFYASMLELLGKGNVVGIDIDLHEHNRKAIQAHPMNKRIRLIQGSSVDLGTAREVYQLAKKYKSVLLFLDSNHTADHVLQELQIYSPLVQKGSYIVVFDTLIETLSPKEIGSRPWGKGNNPLTAVKKFLKDNKRFKIDRSFDDKLLISVCAGGVLKCLANTK